MNTNLLMIAISGDGCEKDGLATVMLDLNQDEATLIKLINEEDINKLNTLIYDNKNSDYNKIRIYHIDALKKYLKETRTFVYPERILNMFNINNEIELFTLFAKTGNVLIQNAGFFTLVYLPKYINDNIKNSIIEMGKYIDEKRGIEVRHFTKNDKIEDVIYSNYNKFINNYFNNTK